MTKDHNDVSAPVKRKRGRPKGSRNKKPALLRAALRDGADPMAYLRGVMTDEGLDPEMRLDAAKALMPYLHSRLATVTHESGEGGVVFKLNMVRRDVSPT